MSKHETPEFTRKPAPPKHSKGWSVHRQYLDAAGIAQTPGKHAKPFGNHHPANPIADETPANVIALRTAPALNLAA